MKKIILFFFVMTCCFAIQGQTETLELIPTRSEIQWIGKKVGGEHRGTVQIIESKITTEDNMPVSGFIRIDMTSIAVSYIESETQNEKLRKVLIADGFFETSNYPEARFDFNSAERISSDRFNLVGKMKIKKTSKETSLAIQFVEIDKQWVAKGRIDIDRTSYDVRYTDGFFSSIGDKAIKDLFSLDFEIYFNPSPSAND